MVAGFSSTAKSWMAEVRVSELGGIRHKDLPSSQTFNARREGRGTVVLPTLSSTRLFVLLAEPCREAPQAFSTPQPTARTPSAKPRAVWCKQKHPQGEAGATLPCISVPAVCHASRAAVRNPPRPLVT